MEGIIFEFLVVETDRRSLHRGCVLCISQSGTTAVESCDSRGDIAHTTKCGDGEATTRRQHVN
jgi:hypothetical protein